MAAVIITQKDVNRLAKELLKEIFDFLHDEYIITNFEEMKKEQEKFLKNLALNHIDTLHRQFKITEEKREELVKPFIVDLIKIDKNGSELEKKCKVEYISKFVKDAMKDDGIDREGIYQTLINLKLDTEINEDLYYKTKTFLEFLEYLKVDILI